MKYNLKPLILATLKERGKSRFNPFVPDIETAMEPLVEEAVRGQLNRVLKQVNRQALQDDDTNNDSNKKGQNDSEN